MKRTTVAVFAILSVMFWTTFLSAHPGHDHEHHELVWEATASPKSSAGHSGVAIVAMVSLLVLAAAGNVLRRHPTRLAVAFVVILSSFVPCSQLQLGNARP